MPFRPHFGLIGLLFLLPSSGVGQVADAFPGPLGAIANLPQDLARYTCAAPNPPSATPQPGHRHCRLRDTLSNGATLFVTTDSTGRAVRFVQSWSIGPDSTASAQGVEAAVAALTRRFGQPLVCGPRLAAWRRTRIWQTETWVAVVQTALPVPVDSSGSVQLEGRFKRPREYVTCMKHAPEA
jgi:hypothetical protein